MGNVSTRPFYTEFGWAYDLVIEGPVSSRCDFVESVAAQWGVSPGSRVLDAECGTGSYSIELAKRGYIVAGIDASAELVSVARAKAEKESVAVVFEVGDILRLASQSEYDVILCRGVLNDILDEQSRQEAFLSFGQVLREDGILVLDVREWSHSALRKEREPIFERAVEVDGGILTFRAVTQVEHKTRQLLVAESHVFERSNDTKVVAKCDFVMKCWTEEELRSRLASAGFSFVACFGDYDHRSSVGSTDRIVAIASLNTGQALGQGAC